MSKSIHLLILHNNHIFTSTWGYPLRHKSPFLTFQRVGEGKMSRQFWRKFHLLMYFMARNSINAKKSYDWLLDAKGNGFQQLISNLNLNRSCRLKTSWRSASFHEIRPRQLCLTAYYICSFNTGVYELGFLEWHAA